MVRPAGGGGEVSRLRGTGGWIGKSRDLSGVVERIEPGSELGESFDRQDWGKTGNSGLVQGPESPISLEIAGSLYLVPASSCLHAHLGLVSSYFSN